MPIDAKKIMIKLNKFCDLSLVLKQWFDVVVGCVKKNAKNGVLLAVSQQVAASYLQKLSPMIDTSLTGED